MRRDTVRKQKSLLFLIIFLLVMIIMLFMIRRHVLASETVSDCKYYRSITIYSGDTLYSIAVDHADELHYEDTDAYIRELRFINHMTAEDEVIPGNHLIIPYYTDDISSEADYEPISAENVTMQISPLAI